MPRALRIVIPGVPHHITHRGNHRQDIFLSDEDRGSYLSILKKQCERTGLKVQGYCLMRNHVHLLATPPSGESLPGAIGQAHRQHALRVNRSANRTGHLWESRYFSCPLDEAHFIETLLYVDRNPVRAGLVRTPQEWRWSSARAHAGKHDPAALIDPEEWEIWSDRLGWEELARQKEDQALAERIRSHTYSGRPLGSEDFIDRLEGILGYPVRQRNRGRPPRKSV